MLGRPVESGVTYYRLRNIPFRVAGPAAWKDKIENADWAALAGLVEQHNLYLALRNGFRVQLRVFQKLQEKEQP